MADEAGSKTLQERMKRFENPSSKAPPPRKSSFSSKPVNDSNSKAPPPRKSSFSSKPVNDSSSQKQRSMSYAPPPNCAAQQHNNPNRGPPIPSSSSSYSFSSYHASSSSSSSRPSNRSAPSIKAGASSSAGVARQRTKQAGQPPKRTRSGTTVVEKEKEEEEEEEEEDDDDDEYYEDDEEEYYEEEFAELSMNSAMRLGGVRSVSAKSIVPVDREQEKTAQLQSSTKKKGKKQRIKLKQTRYGSGIMEKKSHSSKDKRRPQSELLQTVGSVLKTDHLTWPPFSNHPGVYRGEVDSRGVPNGYGELVLPDNARYVGHWVFGRKHGYGSFLWGNGNLYEGLWHEDKRHGSGTETNTNDKSKLTGTFHRGRVNGDAILDLVSGVRLNLKYHNGILLQYNVTLQEFDVKKRTMKGTFTRTMGSKSQTSMSSGTSTQSQPQSARRGSLFGGLFTEPKKKDKKEEKEGEGGGEGDGAGELKKKEKDKKEEKKEEKEGGGEGGEGD